MTRFRLSISLATLMIAVGCQSHGTRNLDRPAVGSGWSRAPDLSVYGAMINAGQLAREQEVLCAGRNPAEVDAFWRTQYGPREAWIGATLRDRHGEPALAAATVQQLGRQSCPTFEDRRWHRAHARLLRMLELRLYPADHWSTS